MRSSADCAQQQKMAGQHPGKNYPNQDPLYPIFFTFEGRLKPFAWRFTHAVD